MHFKVICYVSVKKPYSPAGFKPTILSSGVDSDATMPRRQGVSFLMYLFFSSKHNDTAYVLSFDYTIAMYTQ
jgi:hypothetical protein